MLDRYVEPEESGVTNYAWMGDPVRFLGASDAAEMHLRRLGVRQEPASNVFLEFWATQPGFAQGPLTFAWKMQEIMDDTFPEYVEAMLKYGIAPDSTLPNQYLGFDGSLTAIQLVSTYRGEQKEKMAKVARYLLEKGASPNKENMNSYPPLYCAAQHGNAMLVEELIRFGANVHYRSTLNQNTPLMNAADESSLEVVRVLVQGGSDVSCRNRNGSTAFDIAKRAG